MKASLRSKALFFSLSALVLVGSGCERRGRAPVKADPTSPASVLKPVAPAKAAEGEAKDKKKPEISKEEAQLVADARMIDADGKDCQAPTIDVEGKISKENFATDLAAINEFKKCMTASGIRLLDPNGTQTWTLDASPDLKANPRSAALAEFVKIAHESGSNDDNAFKVMGSRLDLSTKTLAKMGEKYGAKNLEKAELKSSDLFTYEQKELEIGKTLAGIAVAVKALESGKANIAAMYTTKNGVDESEIKSDDADAGADVQD